MTRLGLIARARGRFRRVRRSLQARITVVALLPVLVLATLLGGYMIQSRNADLERALTQRGQLLARQLAAAANYGIFARNIEALESLARAVGKEPDVAGAWIIDSGGQPLAQTTSPRWKGAQLPTLGTKAIPSVRVADGEQRFFVSKVRAPRIEVDDVAEEAQAKSRAMNADAGPALGTVVVAVSDASNRAEIRRFATAVVLLLLAVLVGSYVVAVEMSKRISRPVLQVAHAVQRIGRGEEGVRVEPSRISVLGVLATGFNATAARVEESRHELENRIAQATVELVHRTEEAERADSAKTRFLAAASHDLRQPLHALSMFVSALAQTASESERQHLLRQVESATSALADLLDALLDISRLDAGKVRANVEDVELQPIFDAIYETFGDTAKQKRLELVVRHTRLVVRSDPLLLKQIVTNLVSNAIRYTPQTDANRRARVHVAARVRGGNVRIEVRDNGVGIPEEARETVFLEFEQLSNPERDRSKGLGLGLAIVRRLAKLLGHDIHLRSAPGRGSTFSVDLPRGERRTPLAEAQVVDQIVDGPNQPAGLRVVLVEDDVMVRESLARLLQLWGCEVFESSGAPGLVEELSRQGWRPDAVLCDYRLVNGTTGVEIIGELRRHFGANLGAAIVTGDTEAPALRTPQPDDVPVLFKPVRPAQLRALLWTMAMRR